MAMVFHFDREEFVHRVAFLQGMYYTLESELLRVIEYIPIDNAGDTYSLKFVGIISITVNTMEECLRLITFSPISDEKKIEKWAETINRNREESKKIDIHNKESVRFLSFVELLNFQNEQSNGKLFAEELSGEIGMHTIDFTPFQKKNRAPAWYEDYNSFKHEQFDNRKKANLDNVINSIAALNILYNIAKKELDRIEDEGRSPWHLCTKGSAGLFVGNPLIMRSAIFGTWWYDEREAQE